ncbi:transcription factor HES-2-like [Dromaius novaehollandiae]|uniref:transcription factor HES-2-like n=1 Tax=Dromaius novaehollandiae TaxID=8790 RepID=UPI00311E1A8D
MTVDLIPIEIQICRLSPHLHIHSSPQSLKPLIEKRRRARINASLEQLRRLLQQTPEQQNTRALSRLEKAEILEMTVQQLARLKKPDIAPKNGQDFAAGYRHCLNAVSTFLSSVGSSLDQNTRSHILRQLETTTEMKAAAAPAPSPKVWQPQDDLSSAKPLQSPAFLHGAAPSASLSSGPALAMTSSETQVTARGQLAYPPPTLISLSQPSFLPSLSQMLETSPTAPQMWRPW